MYKKVNISILVFLLVLIIFIGGIITFSIRNNTSDTNENKYYEEICMVIPTYGYVPEDMDDVLRQMNKISIEKCNVKVKLIYTNVEDMNKSNELRLIAGEQIDLMPCLGSEEFNDYISNGTIANLDDLMEKDGSDILSIFPEIVWEAFKKNSVTYGIPTISYGNGSEGLIIRKSIWDSLNIEDTSIPNVQSGYFTNVDEFDTFLTPIFNQIKEKETVNSGESQNNIMKLTPCTNIYDSVVNQCRFFEYDLLGNGLGCVVGNNNEVVNLYETDEYLNMLNLIKRWQDNGYILNLNSGLEDNGALLYGTGKAYGFLSTTGIGQSENISRLSNHDTIAIQLVDRELTTTDAQVACWTIPVSSEHKEAAMKILNLMYSDSEYVNLYNYGIEGTHYKLNNDGTVKIISDKYIQSGTWLFGNSLLIKEISGSNPLLTDLKYKAFEDKKYSSLYGFIYDDSKYKEEVSGMEEILNEYLPILECGLADDVEKTLSEMNKKLYAAGLQEVINDKQMQLNEWLSER